MRELPEAEPASADDAPTSDTTSEEPQVEKDHHGHKKHDKHKADKDKKHKKDKKNQSLTFTDGVAAIKDAVLLDTLKLKVAEAGEALGENDYTAAYDDDGTLIITALDTGKLKNVTAAFADYTYLDPSAVTSADIIGGVDNATNEKKGLETLNQVFPLTRLVPGIVMAPGWSHDAAVAAVMRRW